MIKQIVLLVCTAGAFASASAQEIAVKTNLLYGVGSLTPNLGVEIGLGLKTTLDLTGGYNPWSLNGSATSNKKLVHYIVQPEFRYWTKEKFNGHFFGVHALGSQYNISEHKLPWLFGSGSEKFRHEGYAIGGGVSYGYLWRFAQHWGAEFTVGMGVAYLNYDKYDCKTCGDKIGNFSKTYFGPTKAGISLVYMIGGKKKAATPAYAPPFVPAPKPAPTPEPKPELKPEPAPIVVPQPTTAEKLAATNSFLAPIAEFGQGMDTNPEQYIEDHRDGSLSIYFKVGGKNVDRSYKNNDATLDNLLSAVRDIQNSNDSRVVRVVIAGFASPEGTIATNDLLAHDRAVAIKGYLVENTNLNNNMIDVHNGGIDWAGLRKAVAESDMYKKQQVLDIIDNTPAQINYRTNTSRKKSLMDLDGGKQWKEMTTNYFPELRNATYIRVYFENTTK